MTEKAYWLQMSQCSEERGACSGEARLQRRLQRENYWLPHLASKLVGLPNRDCAVAKEEMDVYNGPTENCSLCKGLLQRLADDLQLNVVLPAKGKPSDYV